MSKWYTTLNAVHLNDPEFDAKNGGRPGIVEVPAGRCIELDDETAKALDKHNAIRKATTGEIADEEARRAEEGSLMARQTLSAARGGMVPADANRAIRQSTGNETEQNVAQTGNGKPKTGKKSPDDGKSGEELL